MSEKVPRRDNRPITIGGMAKNPPTIRMRRLGVELRKIREGLGLTLDEAAELLSISKSALNRMENAQVIVRTHEVRYFIMVYGIADESQQDSLIGLASAGRAKDWVKRYRGLQQGHTLGDLVHLEQDCSAIKVSQPFGIPGLLQTPEYARAVMGSVDLDPGRDLNKSVTLRMARKEALTRPDPIQLDVVIGEAALRQQMGGAEVLRHQLCYLLEASRSTNVTVQVLPFDASRHPGFDGAFVMLDVEAGGFTVVIIDSLARSIYTEDEADVERYNVVFDQLREVALSQADSRLLIERILHELAATPEGAK